MTVEEIGTFDRGLREFLDDSLVQLREEQLSQLSTYYRMLLEWNEKLNLTAVTEPKEAAIKHVVDSLSLTQAFKGRLLQGRLVDVGTGAGLPGVVLKIAFPSLRVTLLDSLRKRLNFLDAVINELGLTGIETAHFRAEDAGKSKEHREQYDLVVARAVARLSVLAEYCVPLCKVGGAFVAYKGPEVLDELVEAKEAVALLGAEMRENVSYELPAEMGQRSLVKFVKTRKTPKKYPRKAGTPAKQPL